MKTQYLALVLALLITGLTVVGVSAVQEDPKAILLIFIPAATTITASMMTLARSQKTDGKVDQLLNGEWQGRITALEEGQIETIKRVGNLETVAVEILDKVSALPK